MLALASASVALAEPPSISGIYPSLATFNNEGECGTGAVVPWADRLWVISYAPHMPKELKLCPRSLVAQKVM